MISFKDTVTKLKDRYRGGRNTTLSNYEFHQIYQLQEESFDTFAVRIKHEANNCNFTCASDTCSVKDTMSRDQIIIGTTNESIRRHALKNQWNLQDLIKNGREIEAAARGAQRLKMDDGHTAEVKRVGKPGKYSRKSQKKYEVPMKENEGRARCKCCTSKKCKGGATCPGAKIKCFDCGKIGHFKGTAICKKRKYSKAARRVESESNTESDSMTESDSSSVNASENSSDSEPKVSRTRKNYNKNIVKVGRVRKTRKVRRIATKPRYQVEVVIKEKKIKAFADTGADLCVMSKRTAKECELPLSKTKVKIRPFGSKAMKCCGYYTGTVMCGDNVANTCIYVVEQEVETLLSGRLSEELGIITFRQSLNGNGDAIRSIKNIDNTKADIMSKHPSVFSGVGTLKDYAVHFYIDENVPPVAEPARPVPFHLRERFNREIKAMEEQGIIEEHEGPAPWVSNVVLAPKDDGGIRLTVDMRQANKAIKATNIPIQTVEEIKCKLAGSKLFSKLDFKSAFHQLNLDKESQNITVFHAGSRLMKYLKLTMGTKPASGELCKALSHLFQHVKGAYIIHDDLIVAGKDRVEHDRILNEVLRIISNAGLTLNPEKCLFSKEEIPFWGLIITKDGIRPDPMKVKALKHASPPKSKEELQSFLCMIQSNRDFLPDLAQKTVHLRKRMKKHNHFSWDKKCQIEFDNLKAAFKEDTLLRHYDPSQNTFLYVDAHYTGLSCVLMQGKTITDAKAVAFASRATTSIEQRYPQLDLEALSIDFALRRFRYFIAGGPEVEIITDHKPLVSIFSNIRKGSIRTSRIKLRHQDICYKVTWRRGKINPADYLSRHATPLSHISKDQLKETKEFEKTVWFIQYSPYTESISMSKIIEETAKDTILKEVMAAIKKGYISKRNKSWPMYHKIFPELTISDDGLIMKEEKIVLPESLWDIAIKKAHQGAHPGMNGLKRRIRGHFWFPQLDSKVERTIKNCQICQMFTNKTMKEPISAHKMSDKTWKDVSIDLFGPMPDQRHVLVVLDQKSRFPAAKIVHNTSAKSVLKALDTIYSDFGQPESHRTDNGPPFDSKAFEKYSNENGIQQIKTFPYHPQANPAETLMKPLGKAMKAAHFSKSDKANALNEFLASYRATPHPATGVTPGDVMFRDGYRKDFPFRLSLTEVDVQEAVKRDENQRQERQQIMNTSKHRKLSQYSPGDEVYVRNMKRTSKFDPIFHPSICKILSKDNQGLLLQRLSDSRILRRHCDDVKPVYNDMNQGETLLYFEPREDVHVDAGRDQLQTMPDELPLAENNRRHPTRTRQQPVRYDDYELY